jgi:hypothetical protein
MLTILVGGDQMFPFVGVQAALNLPCALGAIGQTIVHLTSGDGP